MSLLTFLKNLKEQMKTPENCVYVLGNTSADYDSILGSILYAFLLTTILKIPHIPLIDIPSSDLHLRFQVSYVLEKNSISPSDLIFYNEYVDKIPKHAGFILYDHNQRDHLNVTGILDHHFSHKIKCSKQLIYPVGSALTLIYYLYNPHKLEKLEIQELQRLHEPFLNFQGDFQKDIQNYDPLVDEFLRYGILLDCFGFAEDQKQRWTIYDQEAVKHIEENGKPALTYKELTGIKFNKELSLALNIEDHLRKDYKEYFYRNSGLQNQKFFAQYSVINMNPLEFLEHYGNSLDQSAEKKYNDSHIETTHFKMLGSAYFLMFLYQGEGGLERDILYKSTEFLELKMVQKETKQGWVHWNDPSRTLSRKQFDKYMSTRL